MFDNEDELGWWHLSCSLWAYNTVDCTLHNSKGSTEKEISIDKEDFRIPEGKYTGIFSNSINELFIKDFRFYTKQLTHGEVDQRRYHIDNYPDLIFISNFHSFTSHLKPNYKKSIEFDYDSMTGDLNENIKFEYHAICPPYTYYKNGACYNEPVNQMEVNIFPYLQKTQNDEEELFWRLTVEHSTFINKDDVMYRLRAQFLTNDETLDDLLREDLSRNKAENEFKPFYTIPSRWLRQENQYNIQGMLTDGNF